MKKSLLLVGLAVVALMAPVPGHAANSCTITATGMASGTCSYTATGPGQYEVTTISGFRIEIMSPPERKGSLVSKPAIPENPVSGISVASGDLATQAGDNVALAITVASQTLPNGQVLRYQDGTATAGDKA